jgi:hypothetical protein
MTSLSTEVRPYSTLAGVVEFQRLKPPSGNKWGCSPDEKRSVMLCLAGETRSIYLVAGLRVPVPHGVFGSKFLIRAQQVITASLYRVCP